MLLVDDDASVRLALKANLESSGWRCQTVASGKEALERLTELHPDVILLDVMMPDMDGFETCRRITIDHRHHHIPVILLTALGGQEERLRGLEAGAMDFLTKPMSTVELRARLGAARRLHRAHDLVERVLNSQRTLLHLLVDQTRVPLSILRLNARSLALRAADEPLDLSLVHDLEAAGLSLARMVDDVLALARLGPDGLVPQLGSVHLAALLERVLAPIASHLAPGRLVWHLSQCPPVYADGLLLERVLDNLVAAALRRADPGTAVEVHLELDGAGARRVVRISVLDRSAVPPLPPVQDSSTQPPPAQSTPGAIPGPPFAARALTPTTPADAGGPPGLGLHFCTRAIRAQNGRLTAHPRPGGGTAIVLELDVPLPEFSGLE